MAKVIFLAGAAGAIGQALLPMLTQAGHVVHGTTRKPERRDLIGNLGGHPVVVDVFDPDLLRNELMRIRPEIVINQLTDLPYGLDPARMPEGRVRNALIREKGTNNLVEAAVAAGAKRLISQSIAWAYQPHPAPITEETPLDPSATAVLTLEALTLATPGLKGTVLRYGLFHGPHTGVSTPPGPIHVHVEDAARATHLCVEQEAAGIFNIVADNGPVSNQKAKSALSWAPRADRSIG